MSDETMTSDQTATGAEPPRADRPTRRPVTQKPRRPRGVVVSDPVADMLTRIRNGVVARHEAVPMPLSGIRVAIAKILKAEGFVGGYETASGQLTVRLRYIGGKVPAVSGLRRISKPGLRVYARKTEMPRVLGGLGIAIVSTSSGLMTGREAQRRRLGGEVLAYVW